MRKDPGLLLEEQLLQDWIATAGLERPRWVVAEQETRRKECVPFPLSQLLSGAPCGPSLTWTRWCSIHVAGPAQPQFLCRTHYGRAASGPSDSSFLTVRLAQSLPTTKARVV